MLFLHEYEEEKEKIETPFSPALLNLTWLLLSPHFETLHDFLGKTAVSKAFDIGKNI